MSETSLDLCGIAKCGPPVMEVVNNYSQHIRICDKQERSAAFALFVATAVRSVTERKRSPIRYTGPYHLSRGDGRLNEEPLGTSVTPERPTSRSPQHVAHLTASHRIRRKGGVWSDALRISHAALRAPRLSGGSRPRSDAGCPGGCQLRSPGRGNRQAAGVSATVRPDAALPARWRPGQGLLVDDLRW